MRVLNGRGTRDWTVGQQAELIEHGSVTGFEGQHMKNASSYPAFAGNPDNIQFVTYEEHLYGAHGGKWKNETNGWLNPFTGEFVQFDGDDLPPIPEIELTDKYDPSQYDVTLSLGREFGYGRKEDNAHSRDTHKGEKTIKKSPNDK